MSRKLSVNNCNESGFSVIELLTVVAIIFVLSGISLFYLTAHQRLYRPEEQALLITDMLQEARQRSLTERQVMRVEINRDTNMVTLSDENKPDTVDDDKPLKSISLMKTQEVVVGTSPAQITYNPAEISPVPTCTFKPSVYPTSITQSVCTIRFQPFSGDSGKPAVVDAGNNAVGGGAAMNSVTVQVWSPSKTDPTKSEIARAITILGATGSIRMWEFATDAPGANKWRNSRRSGSY